MRTIFTLTMLLLTGCMSDSPSEGSRRSASDDGLLSEGDLTFFGESDSPDALEWVAPGTFRLNGESRGYAYTRDAYRDFTLRLEFRWTDLEAIPDENRGEANTGVLLFISGEHKVWPRCLEVQGKWAELGQIKSNARDVAVTASEDDKAREEARQPAGQWNELEIVARDGAVTSTLNGRTIANSEPTELREGPIGFQLERFGVEFRNVEIQRHDARR